MTSEQKQDNPTHPPFTEKEDRKAKVAEKIATGILRAQTVVSNRMNRFKYLKLLLICFCINSAVISGYVLIDAIVSKPKKKVSIDRIKTPKQYYEREEELYDEKIPEEVYLNIQAYKKYADSVGERIRRGLADSMRMLEEMYLQQQK